MPFQHILQKWLKEFFCDTKQDNSVDGFAPLRVGDGLCVVHNGVIILNDAISNAAEIFVL
jgi:hypothetical protein